VLQYLAFEILKSAGSDLMQRDDKVNIIYPDVIIDRVAKMFKLSKNEIEKYASDCTANDQNLLIETPARIIKSDFCKSALLSKYFGIDYKPTSVFYSDIPLSTVLDDYSFDQRQFLTDDL
jgi:hypothetical protein